MRKKNLLNLLFRKRDAGNGIPQGPERKKQGFGSGTSKLYFLANLNSRYAGLSSFFQQKNNFLKATLFNGGRIYQQYYVKYGTIRITVAILSLFWWLKWL
jgi:hypothetical protein